MGLWQVAWVALLVGADPQTERGVTEGATPAARPRVSWHSSMAEAQAEANRTGLPLVAHFYADWCGPCQSMENSVLRSSELLALFGKSVVGVKINTDHEPGLTQRHGVTALPTDIFLDAKGKEVGRSVGAKGKADYLAEISRLKPTVTAAVQSNLKPLAPESQPNESVNRIVNLRQPGDSVAVSARPVPPVIDPTHRSERGYIVGMCGFSPVSYQKTQEWKTGAAEFTGTFNGVAYRLCNEEELAIFKANPEKFVPALHGYDPVLFGTERRLVAGRSDVSQWHEGRLFFFANNDSLNQFRADVARFSAQTRIQFFREKSSEEVSMR